MATLFLKYRPKNFSDLIGQESIVKTLQNSLKNQTPSHAYLFSGSRGTGKTSTARIFAKALNCPQITEGDPCGACKTCTDISEGHLIDIIEIDAASHTGVDNIRSIIEKMKFAPTYSKRKVYIIDEVHMLSKGAFNALLKTLEEPPDHVFFLLATTELQKIPETIISRCQTFIFHRFGLDQLVSRLKSICDTEGFSASIQALEIIARKAEGGLRDAISLLEQIAAETENKITQESVRESLGIAPSERLEAFWETINNNDIDAGFEILRNINEEGGDFRCFGHSFLGFLREKLHNHLSDHSELRTILASIEEIETALGRLKTSPIVELPLEIALVNLCINKTESKQTMTASVADPVLKKEIAAAAKPEPKKEIAQDTLEDIQSSSPPANLTEQQIQEKMKEIAERAQIPIFAKRSFLTTVPKIDGGAIDFMTDSDFHKDKLTPPTVHNSLQTAIHELFQTKTPIKFTKGTVHRTQKSVKPEETASVDDFFSF